VLGHPRHRLHALRRHRHMDRRFHRHLGRGIARPHWRWVWRWINGRRVRVRVPHRPRYRRGVAGPAIARPSGAPARALTSVGAPGVRYGRIVGGRCVCAACPSCGSPTTTATVAAAPAYCRCCGQVLR
jgi:hypothetical protein